MVCMSRVGAGKFCRVEGWETVGEFPMRLKYGMMRNVVESLGLENRLK